MSLMYQPLPDRSGFHSPEPLSESAPSRIQLPPHHSIMEVLNQASTADVEQQQASSTACDDMENNNMAFSTASWQSIGEILSSRPTSSVLSSDDTDDDCSNDQATHVMVPAIVKITENISLRGSNEEKESSTTTIELNDDDRTIEIDMNEGFESSISGRSAFVMPEFMKRKKTTSAVQRTANSYAYKILIIGSKKNSFFKLLDDQLRSRFTLDANDSYNIVLVIFDGLVKIGNILNFIKHGDGLIRDKLFIPIFRNINLKIIERILMMYNIELLCSPIHYDNKLQLQHLLEFLNEDSVLQRPNMISESQHEYEFAENEEPADIQSFHAENYQLVRVGQNEDVSENFDFDSIEGYSSTLSPFSRQGSKSVIIKHRVIDQYGVSNSSKVDSSQLKLSKKLKAKKSKRRKYFLLSVTALSLGIGIGIASAYTMSLFSKKITHPVPRPQKMEVTGLEKLNHVSTVTLHGVKLTVSALTKNVLDAKHSVEDVSRFLWYEMRSAIVNVATIWDQWIVSTGGSYPNVLSLNF